MKSKLFAVPARRFFSGATHLLCLATCLQMSLSSHAATLYWDTNGAAAGAGATPSGIWGNNSTYLSTNTNGTLAPPERTTIHNDDVYFVAGTDVPSDFTVTVDGTQLVRYLVMQEGNATFTGGTLHIQNSNSGIVIESAVPTTTTIESDLRLSGASYIDTKSLANVVNLEGGTFTRDLGGGLNVRGSGSVFTTKSGIHANDASGMVGAWLTVGTGSAMSFATLNDSSKIVAYTGITAANLAALSTGSSLTNFETSSLSGTASSAIIANTIRYRGGTATTTLSSSGMSVNGLMNAGSGTWTIAGNTLTIGEQRELVIQSANSSIAISSAIADHSSGSSSITKLSTGSASLSGNNTFTGDVYISQGTVTISHANALGLGAGVTYVNANASGSQAGTLALSGGITVNEDIIITGSGDGSRSTHDPASVQNWSSVLLSSSGNNTITGTVTLRGATTQRLGSNANSTLNLGTLRREGTSSGTTVFSAAGTGLVNVTSKMFLNTSSITIHGGGWARFAASDNELGSVTVANRSKLIIAADQALSRNHTLTVGAGSTGDGNDVGTLYVEGVSFTVNGLSGSMNTSGNQALSSSRLISGYSENDAHLTVGFASNTDTTFDGVIEDGTFGGKMSFTKVGTRTQTFAGTMANTYTGMTTINGGVLQLQKSANVESIAGDLQIGDALGGEDIVRLNSNEQIANTSRVSFSGSGAVAGILRLNGFQETVAGITSGNGAGIIDNNSASASSSLRLHAANSNETYAYSGILRNGNTAALQLTKSGLGTQALSGQSTYTGGTEVQAGTLRITNTAGSATGTGALHLFAPATLSGNGRMAFGTTSRALLQGQIAPGIAFKDMAILEFNLANATGSTSSGITLDGAKLLFDLGSGGVSIDSLGNSDRLFVSGNLNEITDLWFTGNNHLDFADSGSAGWFKLLDAEASSDLVWSGLTIDSASRQITSGLSISGLSDGFSGTLYLGNGNSLGDYGDIYLHVIPEPGRLILASLGLIAFTLRRQRK